MRGEAFLRGTLGVAVVASSVTGSLVSAGSHVSAGSVVADWMPVAGRIVVAGRVVVAGSAWTGTDGVGRGHPASPSAAAGDVVPRGTDGVGSLTSTGAETDWAATVRLTKWLSDAFRTGTGSVVGVVDAGGRLEPDEDEAASAAGSDGAETRAVVERAEAAGGEPAPAAVAAVVPVAGRVAPTRPVAVVALEVPGATAWAGGAGDGGGRAMIGGAAGWWAGTERSALTT